jgi:hypothetical protein
MTKAGRFWGALACAAIFAVFAAACWLEEKTGASVLFFFIGLCFVCLFSFSSEKAIRKLGALWSWF